MTIRGRRTAILVKDGIKMQNISLQQDETTEYLRGSGCWSERVPPVEDGTKHIVVATLYGISGASGNQAEYEDNERFISAALVRMAQMGDVPYYIGADVH